MTNIFRSFSNFAPFIFDTSSDWSMIQSLFHHIY